VRLAFTTVVLSCFLYLINETYGFTG
jgi:hypothetical protein